uniref:Uncharacterized protein n=1 Tax=Glossina pallidipes TaxID=7398 RepID=A0A1A9ZLI2_GLOPL
MPAKTENKGTPQGAQAMRESPEVLPYPFKRSTRIQGSPEQLGGKTTQERSQSSPSILQYKSLMIKNGENSFVELGEKIEELIEMMAPTPSASARRTIHQPMRDLIYMLAVLHKKAAKELGNQVPKKANVDDWLFPVIGPPIVLRKQLMQTIKNLLEIWKLISFVLIVNCTEYKNTGCQGD